MKHLILLTAGVLFFQGLAKAETVVENYTLQKEDNLSRVLFNKVGQKKGIIFNGGWVDKTKQLNPQIKDWENVAPGTVIKITYPKGGVASPGTPAPKPVVAPVVHHEMATPAAPDPGTIILTGDVCTETRTLRADENISRVLFWRVGEKKGIIYGDGKWFEKTKAANPHVKDWGNISEGTKVKLIYPNVTGNCGQTLASDKQAEDPNAQVQAPTITPPTPPAEPKRGVVPHYFSLSAMYGSHAYTENLRESIAQKDVMVKIATDFSVKEKIDIAADGSMTASVLSTNVSEAKATFTNVNAAIGYALVSRPHARLSLMVGEYYRGMTTKDSSQGVSYSGPMLYPMLKFFSKKGHSLRLYVRYSPVTDGSKMLPMGSNNEIDAGLQVGVPISKRNDLLIDVDYTKSKIDLNEYKVDSSAIMFGLGVSL